MNVSYLAVAPEIILVVGALVILIVDVFADPPSRFHGWTMGVTFAGVAGAIVGQWHRVATDGPGLSFGQTVVLDQHPVALRGVLLVVAVLGTLAAWKLLVGLGNRTAEGVALVLVAASGFMLMTAAVDLILLFVALEIGSIALYVLTGIVRNSAAGDEAAVKYFLLGAFASAIFIYGAALTFAGTSSTNLLGAATFLSSTHVIRPAVILIGLGLLIVGLSFKVTAAPFHSWAPDVYQGAPAGVVGFMAAAAKVGGFAALLNILFVGFSPRYQDTWANGIAALAVLSVVVGTLLAIQQSDVRRMLAYSGVAHTGFLLTGMVGGLVGLSGVFYYLATYPVMLVGAFAAVSAIDGPAGTGSSFDSYRGLGRRSPLAAGVLATLLIAMSGMPLTAGFVGKFEMFRTAWSQDFRWLVIVGLLASVAAFFFYLRLVVLMYFQPESQQMPTVPIPRTAGWALILSTLVAVGAGVYPSPLLDLVG